VLSDPDEKRALERVAKSGDALNAAMLMALRPQPSPDTQSVKFTNSDLSINVDNDSLTLPLWMAFAERATADELRDALQALRDFVAKLPDDDELRRPAIEAVEGMRSIDRGIDVRGNPEIVEVSGNVLEYVVRGILAGGSSGGRDAETPFLAARVTLDHNDIQCRAAPNEELDHFAVDVRNTRSASVTNTWARIDVGPYNPDDDDVIEAFKSPRGAVTSQGVRVLGQLGPYGVVRHTHASDFATGVRFQPDNDPGEGEAKVLWLVAETMAEGANTAVEASPSVRQENNLIS
jgi:hypothetical protein